MCFITLLTTRQMRIFRTRSCFLFDQAVVLYYVDLVSHYRSRKPLFAESFPVWFLLFLLLVVPEFFQKVGSEISALAILVPVFFLPWRIQNGSPKHYFTIFGYAQQQRRFNMKSPKA